MLADGDTIASASLTLVAGATIDSQSNTDQRTLATISGGRNGQAAIFTAKMTTTAGLVTKLTIFLPIVSSVCGQYIPSSVTKRTIVEMAWEDCGIPGYQFDATAEENASAVRRLDAMMREWQARSVDLGYFFPTAVGTSDPDDPSLVPDTAITGIAGQLAMRLAPAMGKTISKEGRIAANQAFIAIQASTQLLPNMQPDRNTPRGAGMRWSTWQPYVIPACGCAYGWIPDGSNSGLPILPPGYGFVLDDDGNYVIDEDGNYVIDLL